MDTLLIAKSRCSMFGERAFSHAGTSAWNSLPDSIRTEPNSAVGTILKLTVESFVPILIHFALNDPYYSPYDVISDVIGNPNYSAPLP